MSFDTWYRLSNIFEATCIIYSLAYSIIRLMLPFGTGFDIYRREKIDEHWERVRTDYMLDQKRIYDVMPVLHILGLIILIF